MTCPLLQNKIVSSTIEVASVDSDPYVPGLQIIQASEEFGMPPNEEVTLEVAAEFDRRRNWLLVGDRAGG